MREYKLTEEIARWAFEISIKPKDEWYIAFTNPTAGPWKAIRAVDKGGNEGKIYTFDLKEKRPDIILINDRLNLIIIFEAKTNIDGLISEKQVAKSTKVVSDIGKMLQKMRDNPYWGKRYMYRIVLGLLWGKTNTVTEEVYDRLFEVYREEVLKCENIDKRIIFGIEAVKVEEQLTCYAVGRNYEKGTKTISNSALADSMGIAYKE